MLRTSLIATLAVTTAASLSQAAVVTQFDFNSNPADANTGTGIFSPSIGSGTVTLIGGTTSTFASGDASGGSSDPATGDDSALNLSGFPTQGAASGTAGVQFAVSTVGQQNITVTYDVRHSNTSSRYTQFLYTTNGTTFTTTGLPNGGVLDANAGGDTWYNGRSFDLSAIAAVANNPNFGFEIVTIYDPATLATTPAYTASTSTSAYGTTSTLRFDYVTVGTVPEPTSLSVLALGGLALLRRRRA